MAKASEFARTAIDALEAAESAESAESALARPVCLRGGCTFHTEERHTRRPETYCAPCKALHLTHQALAAATTWRRNALIEEAEQYRTTIRRST